jgi:polyphosphate kinase
MRKHIEQLIVREIKNARMGKLARIILKVNALSDEKLIQRLYDAAAAGVQIHLIIRGIYCAVFEGKKLRKNVQAISIIDEYLEHSRIMIFEHGGHPRIFISSADWMLRNLDHRIEAAAPVKDKNIQKEILSFIALQLQDNVKARVLDADLQNRYVTSPNGTKKIRSQLEIHKYLERMSKGQLY